ncbi:hypothetical protein DSO57_1037437 [Entomophthora muscae]|uniref:Uncharacterized protein n=1 Tax=Entomophthora muscae TaxID=34485 RepID=A0ACC2S0Y3_9FUNG|nr:hypothetical protein DSO57_1037437 [Entomophthora muscae]
MKTQVALISLLVAKAESSTLDSTGIASYCVTHQAFEEQARIYGRIVETGIIGLHSAPGMGGLLFRESPMHLIHAPHNRRRIR